MYLIVFIHIPHNPAGDDKNEGGALVAQTAPLKREKAASIFEQSSPVQVLKGTLNTKQASIE